MPKKLFKIQLILSITYLLLTVFFLLAFHNAMLESFLPTWLSDLLMLFGAVYFGGGAIIIPVAWLILLVYHYQMRDTMDKPAFPSPTKDFLFKQFFPLMSLSFYAINLVYLLFVNQVSSIDFVHFLAFSVLVFSLYVQDHSFNKANWTAFFGLGCGVLVLWFVEMVVGAEFKQAMVEQGELIYGMSYQMMFYLIWILVVFVLAYALIGYFYISNRTKYRHLLMLIVSLFIIFLNIVRQLDVFNRLMLG
ncbi:MAG TPA: hypothetical protein PK087_00955 [Bacilli bacterium]|nr:MAG: hypothetical protein BWY97_01422 [Tenericutes bacterium ADurb.BinA124]HNZ50166.1 hypothetical protein [Bacilli bacterium]HOH17868.1 hypothetical protein [Bacilli bacterium]HPN60722.1 hypothetical protein [Bacilli bacterium]HPX84803.1 hypothetical protein [Bacilli bacterium]